MPINLFLTFSAFALEFKDIEIRIIDLNLHTIHHEPLQKFDLIVPFLFIQLVLYVTWDSFCFFFFFRRIDVMVLRLSLLNSQKLPQQFFFSFRSFVSFFLLLFSHINLSLFSFVVVSVLTVLIILYILLCNIVLPLFHFLLFRHPSNFL